MKYVFDTRKINQNLVQSIDTEKDRFKRVKLALSISPIFPGFFMEVLKIQKKMALTINHIIRAVQNYFFYHSNFAEKYSLRTSTWFRLNKLKWIDVMDN